MKIQITLLTNTFLLRLLIASTLLFALTLDGWGQTTYYWNTVSGSWATAGNWNPSRNTPATNDILIFNNGSSLVISDVPTQSIGKLQVSGNTNVTLRAQSGGNRTLTISTSAIDAMSVTSGSTLTITGIDANPDRTLLVTLSNASGLEANINGTLKVGLDNNQSGASGSFSKGANAIIYFHNGGIYEHAVNGGTIPTATWNANSTCKITGLTDVTPGGVGQSFGHFELAITSNSSTVTELSSSLSCAGNFIVNNTGTRPITLEDDNDNRTLQVGGNMIIQQGTFYLETGDGGSSATITGSYQQSGGTFYLNDGGATTVNIAGDFTQTSGTLTEAGSGDGSIIFNGTYTGFASTIQTYTSGGTISNTISFTVNNGAYLQMAAASTQVTGGGTFTLQANATLGIRATDGIATSGATGHIRVTGTRTYTAGARYIYNGSASQITGTGLTQNRPGNVTIANTGAAGDKTVSLSGTRNISGNLSVNSGIFDLQTYTMNRNAAGGVLTVENSASLKIGGTGTLPSNFSTHALGCSSTVEYAGGDQTVTEPAGTAIYGNLILSGTGTKTLQVAMTNICNDFYVHGSATAAGVVGITVGNNIDIAAGATFNAGNWSHSLSGNWINNGTFGGGSGTITFLGANPVTITGSATTWFYHLTISKSGPAVIVNNPAPSKAFGVSGQLNVIQGTLELLAYDVNYIVSSHLTVGANGTLKHSVDWDTRSTSINVGGDMHIAGSYDYSAVLRAHINMYGAGVITMTAPSTALSILTLSTGDFAAIGNITVNDNFWAMFGTTGSFYTNGQVVTALSGLIINGGSVNIDGGTLNVTGGVQAGYSALGGICALSSGVLNSDWITVGDGTNSGNFNHTGGTANISGNLTITSTGTYTCTGTPAINIGGDWINNGAFTADNSTASFNGASGQSISGSSTTTFYNFTISNGFGVTLTGVNAAANNFLTFTNGIVTTGTNALIANNTHPTAIQGGSSASYVFGTLRRSILANQTYAWPIGSASAYAPVSLAFTSGTVPGMLNGSTNSIDHGSIATSTFNAGSTVNRNWDFTIQSGLTTANYDATFNWVSGDQDPTFDYATAYVGKYSGSAWSYPTVGTRTASSIQMTGGSGFSSFQIGNNVGCTPPTFTTGPGNTDVSCFGGSDGAIILTITSANNSPYTFSVDNGVSYTATFSGTYPNITLTGLSASTYKIRIKDSSGCESVACP